MDGTIITPKSDSEFPQSRTDWKPWHESVPKKLLEYIHLGFHIVLFSNQGGVANGKQNIDDLTGKIDDMIEEFKVPFSAYLSIDKDHMRKPGTGMWDLMVNHLASAGCKIDLAGSFYCGDAAGRKAGARRTSKGKPKKDISDSDRCFAYNIGVPFRTPEEEFKGEAPDPDWSYSSPSGKDLLGDISDDRSDECKKSELPNLFPTTVKPEMVLLIGAPASGKSTLFRAEFEPRGYEWINMDTLKTKAKCIKTATTLLTQGKSVVIDNTNANAESRSVYISIAKTLKIPARAVVINAPKDLVKHMAEMRCNFSKGVSCHIPDVAFNIFFSKYQRVDKDKEGLESVIEIPWRVDFKMAEKGLSSDIKKIHKDSKDVCKMLEFQFHQKV